MKKIAVILLNLGAPDSLKAVRPFLFNLFNDPAILRLPKLLRFILAWGMAKYRTPTAQKIYQQLGGASPLYPNTQAQAQVLEQALAEQNFAETYKVFITMRYWHPMVQQTWQELTDYAPDKVLLLPLYPQFSSTTTGSSCAQWKHAPFDIQQLCCFPKAPLFIECLKAIFLDYTKNIDLTKSRILFSAHGLPEKIIQSGDPYQWQVEQTAKALIDQLTTFLPHPLDWRICYQSRVGPVKWIGPSTEDEIDRAGQDQKGIVLVPISFVSEHSETLVELDIEYKKRATEQQVPFYHRLPTPGTHPLFIKNLVDFVAQMRNGKNVTCSYDPQFQCPQPFTHCPKTLKQ